MGACFSVNLKVRFNGNEDKVKSVLQDFIKTYPNTEFNLDHFSEGGIGTETIDDLLAIILDNWYFHKDFKTEKEDGWLLYDSGFDASYGWESVMVDMFAAIVPYIDAESTFYIEPDSHSYTLGVDASCEPHTMITLEECEDIYGEEDEEYDEEKVETDNGEAGLAVEQIAEKRVREGLIGIGLGDEEIDKILATMTPQEIFDKYVRDGEADIEVRVCTYCGKWMLEGYCIEGGAAYYCSDECMHDDGMCEAEYLRLYADGEGDSFYTEWY